MFVLYYEKSLGLLWIQLGPSYINGVGLVIHSTDACHEKCSPRLACSILHCPFRYISDGKFFRVSHRRIQLPVIVITSLVFPHWLLCRKSHIYLSAGVWISAEVPEIRQGLTNVCLRGPSGSLTSALLESCAHCFSRNRLDSPCNGSQSGSKLGHKTLYLISRLKHFLSRCPKEGVAMDKLCVVVSGINEYEKLNYWILQCKLYFEHKFFISEC